MRRGELLGLEWKHINFRENKIIVEQAGYYIKKEFIIDSPKTSESIREIYFDEEVQEILKEIKDSVFCGNAAVSAPQSCFKFVFQR